MKYSVVFSPEAQDQLSALFRYITDAASPDIASSYTEAIVSYCEDIAMFPYGGTARDDVRSGLRVTIYKKRTVIAYAVIGQVVSVIGVFYGGQDYETMLQTE